MSPKVGSQIYLEVGLCDSYVKESQIGSRIYDDIPIEHQFLFIYWVRKNTCGF